MKLPIQASRFKSVRGSVLIIAIMICALGTIGMAAWISIINARGRYVEQQETVVHARLSEQNGRTLARQYMMVRTAVESSGSGQTLTLYDAGGASWGSAVIPSWSGSALTTTAQSLAVNRFGPANGRGYELPLSVTVNDTLTDRVTYFSAKSRSPILSGHSIVCQAPNNSPGISGKIEATGNILVWAPNTQGGTTAITAQNYTYPLTNTSLTFRNAAGAFAPTNFPFTPITSGKASSTLGYGGAGAYVQNFNHLESSLAYKVTQGSYITVSGWVEMDERGVSCNGSGRVTIDLDEPTLPNVLVQNNVDRVTLVGQQSNGDFNAADALGAVLVVINQTSSTNELAQVRCRYRNNRRLMLGVRKSNSNGYTLRFSEPELNPDWRMIMTAESPTAVSLDEAGTVTLKGGIRTTKSLAGPTGTGQLLTIVSETDGKLLERHADRNVWVESYRLP
ncbi:MAG: hypothetical protein R3F11_13350 [Verrucomicrobiales bacterium]